MLRNGTFIGVVTIAASLSAKYKIVRSLTPNFICCAQPIRQCWTVRHLNLCRLSCIITIYVCIMILTPSVPLFILHCSPYLISYTKFPRTQLFSLGATQVLSALIHSQSLSVSQLGRPSISASYLIACCKEPRPRSMCLSGVSHSLSHAFQILNRLLARLCRNVLWTKLTAFYSLRYLARAIVLVRVWVNGSMQQRKAASLQRAVVLEAGGFLHTHNVVIWGVVGVMISLSDLLLFGPESFVFPPVV
jgi:hypothetical protein